MPPPKAKPKKETAGETMTRVLLNPREKAAAKKPAPKPPTFTPAEGEWIGPNGEVNDLRRDLRKLGHTDTAITTYINDLNEKGRLRREAMARALVIDKESEARMMARLRGEGEDGTAKVVKTESGETVTVKTQSEGKRHKISMFGYSHTAVVMWMGSKEFSLDECKAAFKGMGLPEISEASLRTFLRCGRNPEARVKEKRGDLPNLTEANGAELYKAAGKKLPEPKKPAPAPKVEKPVTKVAAKDKKPAAKKVK